MHMRKKNGFAIDDFLITQLIDQSIPQDENNFAVEKWAVPREKKRVGAVEDHHTGLEIFTAKRRIPPKVYILFFSSLCFGIMFIYILYQK